MTFKEKLAQEHPEKLGKGRVGCIGCPHEYGYAENYDCEGVDCLTCWNREMPDTSATMTAEEVWEIAKRIVLPASDSGSLKASELREIFDSDIEAYILKNFTPQEAKAKIDEWESKQIRVGDVVKIKEQTNEFVVTTMNGYGAQGVDSEGYVYAVAKDRLVKTGKHIDIQSVLEQIGKEE